jgi:hypothetical protein
MDFSIFIAFDVFTAVTMKNAVSWDDTVCVYYKPTFRRNVSLLSSGKKK